MWKYVGAGGLSCWSGSKWIHMFGGLSRLGLGPVHGLVWHSFNVGEDKRCNFVLLTQVCKCFLLCYKIFSVLMSWVALYWCLFVNVCVCVCLFVYVCMCHCGWYLSWEILSVGLTVGPPTVYSSHLCVCSSRPPPPCSVGCVCSWWEEMPCSHYLVITPSAKHAGSSTAQSWWRMAWEWVSFVLVWEKVRK